MGHIYCYTNLINGKKYIGQSINEPNIRKRAHESGFKNEKNHEYNSKIHQAMRKYGYENFEYTILANYIEDIELLNMLEIYYIQYFNCQVPQGYNLEPGGKNCSRPITDEQKEKLMWSHGVLSEAEVKKLRLAYQNNESPTEIYNSKYKDMMHYNSFLNIWSGRRYSSVMPEVFNNRQRHTKLNEETVRQIKIERQETGLSYEKLAQKYNVSKATIAGIIQGRTWKHVQ